MTAHSLPHGAGDSRPVRAIARPISSAVAPAGPAPRSVAPRSTGEPGAYITLVYDDQGDAELFRLAMLPARRCPACDASGHWYDRAGVVISQCPLCHGSGQVRADLGLVRADDELPAGGRWLSAAEVLSELPPIAGYWPHTRTRTLGGER